MTSMGLPRGVDETIEPHRAQLLEAVFRHSPVGMALVSTEGRFMTVNPALSRMLGFTADQLQQLTFQQITHPEDLDADLRLLNELASGERDHYSMIKRYVHHDRHHVYAQLDVAMVRAHSGLPAFYIAQVQDVTHQMAERRELMERLRLALDATEDGIWDWHLQHRCMTVSDPWQTLTGLAGTAGQISWRQWLRQVHPADRLLVLEHLREHLTGVSSRVNIRYRHRHPDGAWRWLSLRGRITGRDARGRPMRITGTVSDIDEQVRTQQDLNVLLNHLPAMISYWDSQLHPRFVNQTFLEWFGHEQVHSTQHASELLDAQIFEANLERMQAVLGGVHQTFEQQTGPAERVRYTRVHLVPDWHGDEVIGFFALGIDITDLREAERALFAQKELAHVTLRSIGDSVITTDPQGLVTFLNPVAQRMTGWTLEDALGQPIETVMPLTLEGRSDALSNPLRLALTERRTFEMVPGTVLQSRTGQTFSVEDSAAPITTETGEQLGGVIVFHDVTEQRTLTERMAFMAHHDPLTGLPNRALLLDHLDHLTRLGDGQHSGFAIAFLDLDGFKAVNDTLGHLAGDELLRQVAGRLQGALRGTDTVSRIGGDEFVFLLPDLQEAHDAHRVTLQLLSALERPFRVGSDDICVTGSVGLAFHPQDGPTADDLMRHADIAMYRAKREGRNRICFFNPQLEQEQRERHHLLHAIRNAVVAQDFELAYQPKVNGRTGEMIGVEALLRWTPNGQAVSPEVFVPLAEEAGQMTALGQWVLRAACEQGRRWLDGGHHLRVAVNVSASQFRDRGFISDLQRTLADTGFAADLLELEVTEAVLMQDIQQANQVLKDLQSLGIRIALDDFGTGYSSLSYLHQLPLNTLKVDRSFVTGVQGDAQRQALLRSVISLGRSMQLEILAEGVETDPERLHLLRHGCEQMQGFLFSSPVRPDHVTAFHSRIQRS